jgi:hypothetical protein
MQLSNYKKNIIVFLITLLFLLLFSPFGIDLTDEGKQMSIAWNIFHAKTIHSYNMHKFGSWFVNGLWLSIIGRPFLLWARLGGVILMTLMTLFSYMISKKYLNNNFTIFILVTSLMFIICENHPETKIDHSNLPTLFALISLFLFLLYIRPEMDFKGSVLFNISASIFMFISILTRVPHILFLFFPVIFFLLSKKLFNTSWKKILHAILTYYVPVFLIIIIGVIYLQIKNGNGITIINKIFNDMFGLLIKIEKVKELNLNVINKPYELKKISYSFFLLHKYIRDSIYIFSLMFFFLIGIIILNILYEKYQKRLLKNKYIEYSFYFIIGLFLFVFLFLKPWMWYMATYGFIFAFLIIIFTKKINLKYEFFYIFWGILFIYISFLGSNNGYRHSVPSGAIFILISIVGLLNYKRKNDLVSNNLLFLNKFTYIFFIVLLIFSFNKRIFNDNKRDVQPVFARDTMFKSKVLSGIFSSKDRVEAIDGILEVSKNYINDENTLLCFNSIPMLYYLLDKDYFLNDPWLIPNNFNSIKSRLENKANNNIYPDYIIFGKKSAKEDNWPDTKVVIDDKDKVLYDYISMYIKTNNYKIIYENKAFLFYKKWEK